jgi:hypothetical protein
MAGLIFFPDEDRHSSRSCDPSWKNQLSERSLGGRLKILTAILLDEGYQSTRFFSSNSSYIAPPTSIAAEATTEK